MNSIFSSLPLPTAQSFREYECGDETFMLVYTDVDKAVFEKFCDDIERKGFSLYDSSEIELSSHRTYINGMMAHVYFCGSDNSMRIVACRNFEKYPVKPESNSENATLWQFEVDHSLIDCGMCYIVKTASGKFFVVDSAHPYSVRDDFRICDFLKKLSGGRKPVVEGWFISHGHEDHVGKVTDILKYHKNELEIKAFYHNLPSLNLPESKDWGESGNNLMKSFTDELKNSPEIKKYKMHTGQRFYIDNLEFTVLCTHEDVFPRSLENFNNTTISLMMKVGDCKVSFPGDSMGESDRVLIRRYSAETLKCDVVQMSHHGHTGTSSEFYRRSAAECALFPITEIKFDEELPRQEPNRVAIEISKEYHIASNGTAEIPLPYKFGQTKVLPDETFEDFNGIFNLWCYEYTDEYKEKLYKEFLERKNR